MTKAISETNAREYSIQLVQWLGKFFFGVMADTHTHVYMKREKVKIIIIISLYSSTKPFGPYCVRRPPFPPLPDYFLP